MKMFVVIPHEIHENFAGSIIMISLGIQGKVALYNLQMFTMHQGWNANARSNTQPKIHHGPENSSRLVHGRTYPNM